MIDKDHLGQPESCNWGFEYQAMITLNQIAYTLDRIADTLNDSQPAAVNLERGRH